jgi:uncharacterized protein YndB with AHSA1/START domain
MEQLTVERSVWIPAPRERVWQAITEPEQVVQWLMPPALGAQMKRGTDGELLVCMGPMELPFAVFEGLEPPRQVTSRSLPDRQLATTYTLDEDNGGTRVTVTVSGLEALPADVRQDRLLPIGMGWEKALANMNAVVAGSDLPFPEGYVAALSGFRRQGQALYGVERSIWIAAPRERVWHAITDPVQIEQWFSPGTPWTMSALEVGGRLFVPNAETGGEMYTQVIEVVDRPHRLVMRSMPEPPEVTQVTTYALYEEQGGTRLTVTNSGYELMPEDMRWSSMEQNAFGFGMMLANVKAVVEGQELAYPGGF